MRPTVVTAAGLTAAFASLPMFAASLAFHIEALGEGGCWLFIGGFAAVGAGGLWELWREIL